MKQWWRKPEFQSMLRTSRFWLIQGIVIVLVGAHDILELYGFFPQLETPYFLPISLLIIPIVLAAIQFGFAGAVFTGALSTVITIPNMTLWHSGVEQLGLIFQVILLDTFALFLGYRVDKEREASRRAEQAQTVLGISERKYRELFQTSPFAIVITGIDGTIVEANPAAGELFPEGRMVFQGKSLASLIGETEAAKLLDYPPDKPSTSGGLIHLPGGDGELFIMPTVSTITDTQGGPALQILLRDMTEEQHHKLGLKAYTARIIKAQEEERQRIARELHDDTIQSIILIFRQIDGIISERNSLPPLVSKQINEVRDNLTAMLTGLRDFTRVLRPLTLDELGMVASIRGLLRDLKNRQEIDTALRVSGDERRLAADAEVGLFRIAQEAIRNIEKHSQAAAATVDIAFAGDSVSLVISDDGQGFTSIPHKGLSARRDQLGLIGMRERAEILGGTLDIRSGNEQGTRILVSVPTVD